MKWCIFVSLLALAGPTSAQTTLVIRPTTTLTALTRNNTSASSSYLGDIGGNAVPGNVSKLPLKTLLYPGATTKLYAHLMGWFGGSGHISVGYTSNDPAQVRRQVEDMISRGISGVIASWDSNAMIQETVPLVLQEAERHPGFEFAIELEEFGYRQYARTIGCDITQKVIDDLAQAYVRFENSPNYLRINGRPVVFIFGIEQYFINWARVRKESPGNPLLIFRNASAFAKTYSDGGFAWSEKSTTDPYDEMVRYLDDFYKAALAFPEKHAFGSGYAGFNDVLASWGANKIMHQHCGQTWLNSFARAGLYYSSGKQLPAMRLVTWNDYEEGTAIEPGVDNCVVVSPSLSGNTLQWSITGNPNTINRFSLYVSTDGQNLMLLKDVASGVRSLELGSFGFAPGTYVLYVRAVGKAGILNKMSGPVKFVPGNQAPSPSLTLSVTSGTVPLTVTASSAGSSDPDGNIVSTTIDFGNGIVASGPSAQYTYTIPGTYTVKATVQDNAGVHSTTSRQVVVHPVSPGIVFSSPAEGAAQAAPVRVQASVEWAYPIRDLSVYLDGSRAFTTFVPQVDRKFQMSDGRHVIEVRATDERGEVIRGTREVTTATPNLPPNAVLTVGPFSGSKPNQVLACTAASSDFDGGIKSYVVDFGDSTINSGVSLVHTYANPGTYTVKAMITDSRGLSSTATRTVTVANENICGLTSSTDIAFCSPQNGSSLASPVSIQAVGGSSVGSVELWIDGNKASITPGSTLNASVPLKAGPHLISVYGISSGGTKSNERATITVIGTACTPLSTTDIALCSPTDKLTYASPVSITAKAGSSVKTIELWVDGKKMTALSGTSLNYSVPLSPGPHLVSVYGVVNSSTKSNEKANITVR